VLPPGVKRTILGPPHDRLQHHGDDGDDDGDDGDDDGDDRRRHGVLPLPGAVDPDSMIVKHTAAPAGAREMKL
jgi:hypothetical protein